MLQSGELRRPYAALAVADIAARCPYPGLAKDNVEVRCFAGRRRFGHCLAAAVFPTIPAMTTEEIFDIVNEKDAVVGQALRYMSFVQEMLAEKDQTVHGMIIALQDDQKIRRALAMVSNVRFCRYQINFKLIGA